MTEPTAGVDLAELCRTHRARLVNLAARLTRTRQDAEDAVQEAFMVALTEMNIIRPRNPAAWLSAVTRRRAMETTHRYARTVASDTLDSQPQAEPTTPVNDGACMADPDTALYVLAALDELTPRQREALRLWALDGLGWPEVAERMGITAASARHTAYASLRRLRAGS